MIQQLSSPAQSGTLRVEFASSEVIDTVSLFLLNGEDGSAGLPLANFVLLPDGVSIEDLLATPQPFVAEFPLNEETLQLPAFELIVFAIFTFPEPSSEGGDGAQDENEAKLLLISKITMTLPKSAPGDPQFNIPNGEARAVP